MLKPHASVLVCWSLNGFVWRMAFRFLRVERLKGLEGVRVVKGLRFQGLRV